MFVSAKKIVKILILVDDLEAFVSFMMKKTEILEGKRSDVEHQDSETRGTQIIYLTAITYTVPGVYRGVIPKITPAAHDGSSITTIMMVLFDVVVPGVNSNNFIYKDSMVVLNRHFILNLSNFACPSFKALMVVYPLIVNGASFYENSMEMVSCISAHLKVQDQVPN